MTPAWGNLLGELAINFLAIMVEALPFMLIGSLAGGLIEVFIPVDWVDRVFRRRRTMAVFLAGGMGIFFPVCECAIVPVVRRLLGKGVPFSAAITFERSSEPPVFSAKPSSSARNAAPSTI